MVIIISALEDSNPAEHRYFSPFICQTDLSEIMKAVRQQFYDMFYNTFAKNVPLYIMAVCGMAWVGEQAIVGTWNGVWTIQNMGKLWEHQQMVYYINRLAQAEDEED
eukprot:TRINITY_DN1331_c0_g1_i5.p3 TRINITY_DN1331_c0_g1~~TRINITY_DN1331_c0_g1_i5.p3  ORF type:complete len:107 (-),score=12.19 TRINITY_DN1331_c0_g1_i5:148-468(-)